MFYAPFYTILYVMLLTHPKGEKLMLLTKKVLRVLMVILLILLSFTGCMSNNSNPQQESTTENDNAESGNDDNSNSFEHVYLSEYGVSPPQKLRASFEKFCVQVLQCKLLGFRTIKRTGGEIAFYCLAAGCLYNDSMLQAQ